MCLEDSSPPQTINAVAPEPVRQRDFARALGAILERPASLPAPAFAIRLILGGFSEELLASKRVAPEAAQDAGYLFAFPELESALRDALR
jgi:NAD dependent epimerase/dehydratase family enzyme